MPGKGSKKYLRKVKKNEKRIKNKSKNYAKSKGLGDNTNTCSAIRIYGTSGRHSKAITTRSSAMGRGAGVLVGYDEADMPWADLEPVETYPFINCAEAQAYLRVLEKHDNPKHYKVTSFRPDGGVNPPCGNCSLWVYDTFGDVVDS